MVLPGKGRNQIAAREVSMRKIKEVLRLRSLGLNQHQIARSCSIAQSTVHEYVKAAEVAGIAWPYGRIGMTANWKRAYSRLARKQPVAGYRHYRISTPSARSCSATNT
jgi:hypothetical protein